MNLSTAKAISAVILMILTFVASMLPLCFFRQPLSLYDRSRDRHTTRRRVLSFLSCFAGGVFLGTCLLHLFPDVTQQAQQVVSSLNLNHDFPIAEFLVGIGFLLILIIEQITLHYKLDFPAQENSSYEEHRENLIPDPTSSDDMESSTQNTHYVSTTYGAIQGQNEPNEYNIQFAQDEAHSQSIFHSLLLLLALSMHSVFEGLAIGLQTTIRDDLRILLAVLIHKCIIAFSLGLNLTNSQMGIFNIFKSNLFFSLTSPVGILFGLAVTNLVAGIKMIITGAVLQGMAAGTFLYITLFEVLLKEFKEDRDPDRMLKVLSVVIGFSVVCMLIIFLPD